MSFFQEAYQVSIGQGQFSAITGNQANNTYNHYIIERQKKKRGKYDEFPNIQRGRVRRIKDLDHKESYGFFNSRLQKYEEFRVERTISTAKIHGDSSSSSFTVVSYKGQDAQKAWKKEFREFSEATNTTKMQLFGINRSSVPLLVFHGELVPLYHFLGGLGVLGQGYAHTLASNVCCESEAWIDLAQGTLIRGVEGHARHLYYFKFKTVGTLPSSASEFLDEDVCFRYMSRLSLVKKFDREVIDRLSWGRLNQEFVPTVSPIINRPYILSTKTNSIIAVGSAVWLARGPLGLRDRVLMPDGRTRFTLPAQIGIGTFSLSAYEWHSRVAWHSHASSVFNRLGIPLDDDLSSYELILPSEPLCGSVRYNSEQRPTIYLFVPICLPFELELDTHTWSFDENGRTPIPRHHCKDLGLPTKLERHGVKSKIFSWPSETYKTIHKWQTARGFDPTTTDFAHYLGYGPATWEVMPSESSRFEELCAAGPSEGSTFAESPCKNDQGQSMIGSIWSAITAPLTYAADEDSNISAALM
ncbi:hypothetical protein E1B28_005243 [Marasmius oreades]|uniref:Uncharacterized protein n=1 Tax=Marasmius oreades TaxID=181124 RepID=A0A9P8ADT0_9AGAR|nr:uncharacterized protein E1B28_005243 [Marasmius oreades]KAG7097932.1 hypothetical protein E1B28_005243 [Marasmius oreades]